MNVGDRKNMDFKGYRNEYERRITIKVVDIFVTSMS